MRAFKSAHKAAEAHAGAHKSRVTNWTEYTDKLIRKGEIRPIASGRTGRELYWTIIEPSDWWVYRPRTEHGERRGVVSGPHQTKREAMRSAGYSTASRVLVKHNWKLNSNLFIVQTRWLDEAGEEY
jgi:hypothetical protein